jgi:hypothetical protein
VLIGFYCTAFCFEGGRKGMLVQRSSEWARIFEAQKASKNEIRKCHRNCKYSQYDE